MIWTKLGVKLLAFHGKYYLFGHWKLEEMGLPITLIWTRLPQCVRIVGRYKTLRGCAIRPPKKDNIIHMRALKCDEAFFVLYCTKYRLIKYGLTNKLLMNDYIMLLFMREWFCLNALWKVKTSHEKKFLMKSECSNSV